MAIGAVTKFNGLEAVLFNESRRQWNDSAVGNCMFILLGNSYIPDPTDVSAADITGVITAGDGAPLNVGTPILDNSSSPGSTFYSSSSANFGSSVTITAKYILCVQPSVAGVFANDATDLLLWYVDLDDTTTSTTLSSSASDFIINTPANGWFSTT